MNFKQWLNEVENYNPATYYVDPVHDGRGPGRSQYTASTQPDQTTRIAQQVASLDQRLTKVEQMVGSR